MGLYRWRIDLSSIHFWVLIMAALLALGCRNFGSLHTEITNLLFASQTITKHSEHFYSMSFQDVAVELWIC